MQKLLQKLFYLYGSHFPSSCFPIRWTLLHTSGQTSTGRIHSSHVSDEDLLLALCAYIWSQDTDGI